MLGDCRAHDLPPIVAEDDHHVEALSVEERSIDELFDFAVIDHNGVLKKIVGGIPLRTAVPKIPSRTVFSPVEESDDETNAVLFAPIVEGTAVGGRWQLEFCDNSRALGNTPNDRDGLAQMIQCLTGGPGGPSCIRRPAASGTLR
jgi:hypothetical protein